MWINVNLVLFTLSLDFFSFFLIWMGEMQEWHASRDLELTQPAGKDSSYSFSFLFFNFIF